jgi:transcriptional regulator of acetoin/glycerol metabolism
MSGRAVALRPQDRLAADAWERFVRGEEVRGGVRADVLLSWHRCRDDYRVDPARESAPPASEATPSADAAVVAAELGAAAMEMAPDVETLGGVVSVADGVGRVLSAWGDRGTLARARDQNLGPWFAWSESGTGTTGIGLALESRGAVSVVGSEHWCAAFQDWSCNAVAVRDPATNEPVGVIAVSAWRRTVPEATIGPLVQAVRRVERRLDERFPASARMPRSPLPGARTRVAATHAGRLVVVFADEILLAEFEEGVVWLQTEQRRLRAVARNLAELEQRLGGAPFFRVSRQVLVNVDRVREVTRSRRRGVWIGLDGADVLLPVSRRRVPELRRALRLS